MGLHSWQGMQYCWKECLESMGAGMLGSKGNGTPSGGVQKGDPKGGSGPLKRGGTHDLGCAMCWGVCIVLFGRLVSGVPTYVAVTEAGIGGSLNMLDLRYLQGRVR
jgi:hypothetical protein